MSPCGTFALVGSVGGAIDMYNLQSGQHRRRFPARLTPAEAKKFKLQQLQAEDGALDANTHASPKFAKGQGRHKGAVTGLAVDSLNRIVISCGDDGKVKVRSIFSSFSNLLLTSRVVLGLRNWNSPARNRLVPDDKSRWLAISP